MIDCPAPNRLPLAGVTCGLVVAGCHVDLAFVEGADRFGISAAAARLAEGLVAARIGCERRLVRVASLMPSGRPVATVRGRASAVSVSVAHIDGLFGAAVCAAAGVGLDIVAPAEAGPALDAWFTPGELALPPEDGLVRARLWAAKEAAFKAVGLDDGFRPRAVAIEQLDPTGFRWSIRRGHRHVGGRGVFAEAGTHLAAVAAVSTPFEHRAGSR